MITRDDIAIARRTDPETGDLLLRAELRLVTTGIIGPALLRQSRFTEQEVIGITEERLRRQLIQKLYGELYEHLRRVQIEVKMNLNVQRINDQFTELFSLLESK